MCLRSRTSQRAPLCPGFTRTPLFPLSPSKSLPVSEAETQLRGMDTVQKQPVMSSLNTGLSVRRRTSNSSTAVSFFDLAGLVSVADAEPANLRASGLAEANLPETGPAHDVPRALVPPLQLVRWPIPVVWLFVVDGHVAACSVGRRGRIHG